MYKKILLSTILTLLIVSAMTQQKHKCAHRVGFDRSWISDTLDALNYRIHLTVTDFGDHVIMGKTEVDLEAKIDGVDEILLELKQLNVDSMYVNNVFVESFTHENDLITIPLDEPINTGDQLTVRVNYSGVPFNESWGGFHWSGQKAFNLGVGISTVPHNLGKAWFPCIDDFHDRAYYDVWVTVEDDKRAICGGLLVEIMDNNDGTDTYHWSLSHTIPTYLASVAVGDYIIYEDVFNGLEADIPIEIYGGSIGAIEGSFLHLKEILAIYEDKYGPYPWERVGYVATGLGAMEHVTNIAYPGWAIDGTLSYETLLAHELSHMWFGDNVTCSSAEEMWLNEGWATYSESLFQEELYGYNEYIDDLLADHRFVMQYCHTSEGDGGNYALNDIPQNVTYQYNAYERGSTVVHSLRGYLGDEVFFDALAAYNDAYQYNYASSYDMEEFLTAYTGIDMHGFFENWVYTPGTPHYAIDSFSINPGTKGADVYVRVQQKHKGYDYIGDNNIVEVSCISEIREVYTDSIHFDGSFGDKLLSVPFEPVYIICDYHDKLLDAVTYANVNIDQTGYISEGGTYILFEVNSVVDPCLLRVEHQWAPPDPMKTPIQGLTLSDYRYWSIYGEVPENLDASCFFNYSVSGFLDDGLIINPDDSLVILYREFPWEEWQFINFTQSGGSSNGHLIVDQIQPGEYTLAVCDDTFTAIPSIASPKKEAKLQIYPNPSDGPFTIKSSAKGIVKVHDIKGVVKDTIQIDMPDKAYSWLPENIEPGTYFLRLLSEDFTTLCVEQIIVQ